MKVYPQINTVRIEIEPDKVSEGKQWIQNAVNHGYEVIATYHKCDVLGTDNSTELLNAAYWWVSNYEYLNSSGPFMINLMNEWGSHYQTPESYSDAYNAALAVLRQTYTGPVVIDIPGWGQETRTAHEASPLVIDLDVILSAHVYPNGWNEAAGHNLDMSDMNELMQSGRPCLIGEFGTDGSGPVNVSEIVTYAKNIGFVGVLAWAWNGDGGDMNMASPPWYDNPTAQTYEESNYFDDVIALI